MTRLVPNASPLVAGLDATIAARFALPIDGIADQWSPERCPADRLAYLAWALSIDLWDDDWPELKKRQVCARAFELHRSKTTLAGIKAHVELVGSTVTRAIRPPARGFLRSARTPEELHAWRERQPQLRIYPFAHRAIARRRSFAGGPGAGRQFGTYLRSSRGTALFGRHATYFDGQSETPVSLSLVAGDVAERVVFAAGPSRRSFVGHAFAGHGWLRPTVAASRVVTVRTVPGAPAFAVPRSIAPVDVSPDRIAVRRIAPAARAFSGRRGGFLRSSAADLLIYDRIALQADAAGIAPPRRMTCWGGRGRFGIAPFTAELRIAVPLRRTRRRGARWNGVGFLKSADLLPLARTLEAVTVSKAARDTILIDTALHGRARFGAGLRFGDFNFGDIRKA